MDRSFYFSWEICLAIKNFFWSAAEKSCWEKKSSRPPPHQRLLYNVGEKLNQVFDVLTTDKTLNEVLSSCFRCKSYVTLLRRSGEEEE